MASSIPVLFRLKPTNPTVGAGRDPRLPGLPRLALPHEAAPEPGVRRQQPGQAIPQPSDRWLALAEAHLSHKSIVHPESPSMRLGGALKEQLRVMG